MLSGAALRIAIIRLARMRRAARARRFVRNQCLLVVITITSVLVVIPIPQAGAQVEPPMVTSPSPSHHSQAEKRAARSALTGASMLRGGRGNSLGNAVAG